MKTLREKLGDFYVWTWLNIFANLVTLTITDVIATELTKRKRWLQNIILPKKQSHCIHLST